MVPINWKKGLVFLLNLNWKNIVDFLARYYGRGSPFPGKDEWSRMSRISKIIWHLRRL